MDIDIWSDIACPWCYVGKRRLETALESFEHRDQVNVRWHSFELDPDAPHERRGEAAANLAQKYGTSRERAVAMLDGMTATAAADGLEFHFERARAGKLGADDLTGGTFTVNNTGANGSIMSAPIINGGQAGIVTMEAVVKRPVVVKGDAIAIRSMMNVCLSLDHRVVDGAVASGFLVDLRKRLEAMDGSGTL